MAEQVVSDSVTALSQSEIRRSWYIESMQSERVKVLVGTNQDEFKVPYDLLAQYSRDFKKLRNALNDSGDEITLPDVTKPTFEDFFVWLHAYEPSILNADGSESEFVDGALNLAVFAQKYKIYHLRNQASDVVRSALGDGKWNITPDMISAVYRVAPAGSALRQLSFLGFVASEGRTDSTLWQTAFHECQGLRYIPQKITMVTDSVADPTGGSVAAQKFIFLVTDLKPIRLRAMNKLSLMRLLS